MIARVTLVLGVLLSAGAPSLSEAHPLDPVRVLVRAGAENAEARVAIPRGSPCEGRCRLAISTDCTLERTWRADDGTHERQGITWRCSPRATDVASLRLVGLAEAGAIAVVHEAPFGDGEVSIVRGRDVLIETAERETRSVLTAYLAAGVTHVLAGWDHLAFIICLTLLISDGRRLLAAVTAFTVGHSISLAAATFGWLELAAPPIEATIAASILVLASELSSPKTPSLVRRAPAVVAAIIGLIHGLGFAEALRDLGWPERSLPMALLGFNLGVELGQLTVVAGVLSLAALAGALHLRSAMTVLISYGAGTAGAYWLIERIIQL